MALAILTEWAGFKRSKIIINNVRTREQWQRPRDREIATRIRDVMVYLTRQHSSAMEPLATLLRVLEIPARPRRRPSRPLTAL
jgi:hypothetical protein